MLKVHVSDQAMVALTVYKLCSSASNCISNHHAGGSKLLHTHVMRLGCLWTLGGDASENAGNESILDSTTCFYHGCESRIRPNSCAMSSRTRNVRTSQDSPHVLFVEIYQFQECQWIFFFFGNVCTYPFQDLWSKPTLDASSLPGTNCVLALLPLSLV